MPRSDKPNGWLDKPGMRNPSNPVMQYWSMLTTHIACVQATAGEAPAPSQGTKPNTAAAVT
jgi:hypothetical protein